MGNSTGFPHFGQSTSCPVPATVERNVYLPSAASPRSQSTTTTECIVKRYFLLDMGLWDGYGRRVNHELRREPASRARFRQPHPQRKKDPKKHVFLRNEPTVFRRIF